MHARPAVRDVVGADLALWSWRDALRFPLRLAPTPLQGMQRYRAVKHHEPVCPACSKLIEPGMPVTLNGGGDLVHRWCNPRAIVTKPAKPATRRVESH